VGAEGHGNSPVADEVPEPVFGSFVSGGHDFGRASTTAEAVGRCAWGRMIGEPASEREAVWPEPTQAAKVPAPMTRTIPITARFPQDLTRFKRTFIAAGVAGKHREEASPEVVPAGIPVNQPYPRGVLWA
jgi:hypothetical protein